jgi:hypothetical protein
MPVCVHVTNKYDLASCVHRNSSPVRESNGSEVQFGVQAAIPGHMHDQYVEQYANSPYELYAEFSIN